jgi:hypothetical protein
MFYLRNTSPLHCVLTCNPKEKGKLTVRRDRRGLNTKSMFSSANSLIITLKAKVSELDDVEVTVNTGYQSIPKERATGSFVFIDNEQLNRRVATDIISKLEGITNGLVFNRDPLTGKNQLRIRGESTIYSNSQPLIVVDNFPYDGDLNNINPYDIADISILIDVAAASIWGVRTGNGVIVISFGIFLRCRKKHSALFSFFFFVIIFVFEP